MARYVKFCLRLSIPAQDWHRLEDCVEERYQKVLATRGQDAATQWARAEAAWFLMEGLKRLLDPRTWL